MQQSEGEFMLHQIRPVARFQSLGQKRAADISSVYEEKLKIPVGAHHGRASQKTVYGQALRLRVKGQKLARDLPAVNAVNDLSEIPVSRGMEAHVPVDQKLESHVGPGQRHMLHQVGYIASLRRRGLQKLFPHRRVEKKLAHNHRGALRRADLGKFLFHPAVQPVMDPGKGSLCFGDQLHHGNRRDAGKRLTAEAQAVQMIQVLRRADLAGGMPEKGLPDLLLLNAVPVVRHADKGASPVPDLHRHSVRSRVHGVFHQLLHHAGGPLHHLARRDLVYRIAVKQPDLCHSNLLPSRRQYSEKNASPSDSLPAATPRKNGSASGSPEAEPFFGTGKG